MDLKIIKKIIELALIYKVQGCMNFPIYRLNLQMFHRKLSQSKLADKPWKNADRKIHDEPHSLRIYRSQILHENLID